MMKTIILAAAAASVLAAAAPASAQSFGGHDGRGRTEQVQQNRSGNRQVQQNRFQQNQFAQNQFTQNRFGNQNFRQDARQNFGQDFRNRQVQARRWNQGERFDSRYATDYRLIGNPYDYGLRQAPRGYRWVQSGNDAVLVAIAGGLIGAVLANAF